MNKNQWISTSKEVFARWRVTIPPPRGDIEPALQFALAVAAAGEQEQVWTPIRLRAAIPFERSAAASLEVHLRTLIAERGAAPMFHVGSEVGSSANLTPALLSYFDEAGNIVDAEVANVGDLVRQLHRRTAPLTNRSCGAVSPVILDGPPLFPGGDRALQLDIRLQTDIWFPRVDGWIEDEAEDGDLEADWSAGPHDNSALAARHTPRFNRFLAEVRRAAIAVGGSLELGEGYGYGELYTPEQVDEHGILI